MAIGISFLDKWPENCDPVQEDFGHIIVPMGSNISMLVENNIREKCRYIIVVNQETGERIRLNFEPDNIEVKPSKRRGRKPKAKPAGVV